MGRPLLEIADRAVTMLSQIRTLVDAELDDPLGGDAGTIRKIRKILEVERDD